MNKWMKQGMAGLILSTSALTVAQTTQSEKEVVREENSLVSVDALDFAGGSKLKDRMMMITSNQNIQAIHVLIKA